MKLYKDILKALVPPTVKNSINNLLSKISSDEHDFGYTINELVGIWENSNWATENWHGKILDNEILRYKTSDTIFLLGSGPSINDISAAQWEFISKNNSIGFNWWFMHEFVPDLFMFQAVNDSMLQLLADSFNRYKKIPFLIRGSAFANGIVDFSDSRFNRLKDNPVFFVNEYPVSSKFSMDPLLLYKYLDALGFMSFGKIASFVPKFRCTLGLLIMLSYQMGYKNIVLCGMDMQEAGYFWDLPPYFDLKQKYITSGSGLGSFKTFPVKTFTDTNKLSNSVPGYVYSLQDWMRKRNQVNFYLANKKSVLYPKIPVFKF